MKPPSQWKSNMYYILSVFLALGVQLANRLRHTVISGLSDSTIFFHIVTQTARFSEKKKETLLNTKYVLRYSTTFVSNISHSKKNRARYDQKYIYWFSCKVPVILLKF